MSDKLQFVAGTAKGSPIASYDSVGDFFDLDDEQTVKFTSRKIPRAAARGLFNYDPSSQEQVGFRIPYAAA